MFVKKSVEEIAAMTDEVFKLYQVEKEASEEIKAAKIASDLEAVVLANKGLEESLKAQGLEMAKMKNETSLAQHETLETELKSKMDAIKAIAKREGSKDVDVVKATTIRASITDNTESFRLPDIARLAHTKLSMYDAFPKIPISTSNNNGVISYTDWDVATTVRAANMILETGTFPESTATWVEKTIALQKVGDTLPVSEEFYEDEARFAAELELFLQTNIQLKVDGQIALGDGIAPNLRGLTTSSTAFSATGLTTVPNATFYDLLAVTPEMNIGFGSKYDFDVVFMNKKEINRLRLAKDANNNYIIPPFVSPNGTQVDGMVVLESNIMADNTCILGDRRYGKIYEKAGVTMARGTVNAQFNEDLETIKVRKRLAFLVRESEARAFIYISDITAAITAITAV